MAPFTRKAFYDLSFECRELALELARHDQHRVYPHLCRDFNRRLSQIKAYDPLRPYLASLTPARPITRTHVLSAGLLLWLVTNLFLPRWIGLWGARLASMAILGLLIVVFFLPESVYGTTVEMLEAKLLRVVDALDALLRSGEMEVTEAVYFRIKENLAEARRELRQQIDLAHR